MSFPDEVSTNSEGAFGATDDSLYPIEHVAHLVCISSGTIQVYCEHGLLTPFVDQKDNTNYLNDEAIRTLRRIEALRMICGDNLGAVRLILELSREVERLESEVRFLRK